MRIILIMLVWLMLPIAFVVVCFDAAKVAVEHFVEATLNKKKT